MPKEKWMRKLIVLAPNVLFESVPMIAEVLSNPVSYRLAGGSHLSQDSGSAAFAEARRTGPSQTVLAAHEDNKISCSAI